MPWNYIACTVPLQVIAGSSLRRKLKELAREMKAEALGIHRARNRRLSPLGQCCQRLAQSQVGQLGGDPEIPVLGRDDGTPFDSSCSIPNPHLEAPASHLGFLSGSRMQLRCRAAFSSSIRTGFET